MAQREGVVGIREVGKVQVQPQMRGSRKATTGADNRS